MKRLLFMLLCLPLGAFSQTEIVTFVKDEAHKKIEVLIGNKPFTAYYYPDSSILKKAVLYPVRSANGTIVTRGWPIEPRIGERVDHPHHVGIWLNYEAVNGHDFWNNSNTPPNPKATYGTIVHTGIKKIKGGKNKGELVVTANWLDKNGKAMLIEETQYIFRGTSKQRIIDRITTLKALDKAVDFPDVKDGLFAIRVARELEMPSTKPEVFTDASGVATAVPVLDNTGVSGNYRNSNGIEGETVWAKRAKWVNLSGIIGTEDVSILIIDHPNNVGYPAYWHARGYGLFSVNPLGQKIFSEGKETLNFKLTANQSVTFRYRTVITSAKVSDTAANQLTQNFTKIK